ncbi:substrate binding domain-containing protein [Zhongshania sp. BJYM1]|jgi:DNA-binding transcriptional LysR family regulator|uniref:substrate binding domain-containing protein n=1 Tax=Zhongshania aquatica TaxID=2965069 RepID=UPI0022B43780|nr:substrate binding domain-containing protein [Marortus sp. BJYM1]
MALTHCEHFALNSGACKKEGCRCSRFAKFSVHSYKNTQKVDIVEEGFDIALRIGHLKSSSLIAKRLAPVRLVLCASPAYLERHGTPRRPEDLANHHYLRYSYMDMDAGPPAQKWLHGCGRGTRGEMVSNNGDVLVESAVAVAGAGIALQPTFIAGAAIKEGKLKMLLPEYEPEPMELYAVYAHRQLLASKVRSFIDGFFGDPPYWDRFD